MTTRYLQLSGWKRFSLAVAGCALILGAGATAASFTDFATGNLTSGANGPGIGNPHRFDIAVKDANGKLQDAQTPASAVVLDTTASTGLSESAAVEFEADIVNRNPGITGDLLISVYNPDTENPSLFGDLLFTVYLDGSAQPAISHATAAQVNSAGLKFTNVLPGEDRKVKLSLVLAKDTTDQAVGKTAEIGILANGESR